MYGLITLRGDIITACVCGYNCEGAVEGDEGNDHGGIY